MLRIRCSSSEVLGAIDPSHGSFWNLFLIIEERESEKRNRNWNACISFPIAYLFTPVFCSRNGVRFCVRYAPFLYSFLREHSLNSSLSFFSFFFFSFSFFSFLALLLDGFQIRELALFSRRRNNTTIDISIALSFFCFVYSHMQMYSQLALYIIRIDIAALACYQRYHDFIASTCVRAQAYFQINIFINVIHYFAWNFADDSLQIPNIMKISHVRNIIRNVTFRTNIVAGAITASCYHVTSFIVVKIIIVGTI